MAATAQRPETDPSAPRRYRDLTDVDWPTFADGEVPVWDAGSSKWAGAAKQDAGTAATDAELAAAVATIDAALAAKQDAATAATDAELAAAVSALNAAIAAKQDASSAATDAELAALDAEHDAAEAALTAAIAAKQDASTAATDVELAAAQAALNASIALKQDASTAATDSELAAAVATLNASLLLKQDALTDWDNDKASADAGAWTLNRLDLNANSAPSAGVGYGFADRIRRGGPFTKLRFYVAVAFAGGATDLRAAVWADDGTVLGETANLGNLGVGVQEPALIAPISPALGTRVYLGLVSSGTTAGQVRGATAPTRAILDKAPALMRNSAGGSYAGGAVPALPAGGTSGVAPMWLELIA